MHIFTIFHGSIVILLTGLIPTFMLMGRCVLAYWGLGMVVMRRRSGMPITPTSFRSVIHFITLQLLDLTIVKFL